MLERLTHGLRLDVSATALRLYSVARWRRAAPVLLAQVTLEAAADVGFGIGTDAGTGIGPSASAGSGSEALAAGMATLIGAYGGFARTLRVVLADELTRLWHVTPPPGAMQLADLRAAAAARFQALYGEPVAAWQVRAAWDTQHPFVAVAVPLALLATLRQGALQHRLTLVGVVPHFIGAWNRWCGVLRAGAWFGVLHGPVLTVGVIVGGRLQTVRSIVPAAQTDLAGLERSIVRQARLLDVAAPALLQICGAVPSAWLQAPVGAQMACQALEPQARIGRSTPGTAAPDAAGGVA